MVYMLVVVLQPTLMYMVFISNKEQPFAMVMMIIYVLHLLDTDYNQHNSGILF